MIYEVSFYIKYKRKSYITKLTVVEKGHIIISMPKLKKLKLFNKEINNLKTSK